VISAICADTRERSFTEGATSSTRMRNGQVTRAPRALSITAVDISERALTLYAAHRFATASSRRASSISRSRPRRSTRL